MKKTILLSISLPILLSACASTNTLDQSAPGVDSPFETTNTQTEASTYTIDEVSLHRTEKDCWMIIDNKVYDVSSYSNHPGGDALYQGCGIDATVLFENSPPHSDKARKDLEKYYIGSLTQ